MENALKNGFLHCLEGQQAIEKSFNQMSEAISREYDAAMKALNEKKGQQKGELDRAYPWCWT